MAAAVFMLFGQALAASTVAGMETNEHLRHRENALSIRQYKLCENIKSFSTTDMAIGSDGLPRNLNSSEKTSWTSVTRKLRAIILHLTAG